LIPPEHAIRDRLRQGEITPDQALVLVETELATAETSSLLVLRGMLTLVSERSTFTLQHARASFERAIELAPDDAEAYEELAHFFDAVEPDRERAERFYRLAVAKGAGAACQDALDQLLAE
jgi:tetratricopeptide (TPR) repeat protein